MPGAGAAGRWRVALALAASVWAVLAIAFTQPPSSLAAGLSGNGALNELTKESSAEPEETSTATTSTTGTEKEESKSTSRPLLFGAIGAAVLLLLAIAFVIIRDARRVAPAGDPELMEARAGHDAAVRLRKRRAKAKAARQQRKRNRQASR